LRGGMRSEAREARWERVAVAVGRSVKAWSSREREMRKRVGEWCQRSEKCVGSCEKYYPSRR
jgi:hypothetical protein